MNKEIFNITGMSCSACSARVQKAVAALNGVADVSVNLLKNNMMVSYDPAVLSAREIIDGVEKGFENPSDRFCRADAGADVFFHGRNVRPAFAGGV